MRAAPILDARSGNYMKPGVLAIIAVVSGGQPAPSPFRWHALI
jgi:hypothetical protein